MSKTHGEGRAEAERSQLVFTTFEYRKAARDAKQGEEREWAEQSGPVTVRRVRKMPPRCHCGRFMGLVNGARRCSLEVPVQRGWLREHL